MKCIFIDLDGTLLPHSCTFIPEKNKEALLKAHNNGHKLILSTGRSYADLEDEVFDLPFDYYILAAGGVILNSQKELLFNDAFQKEDVLKIIDSLKKHDVGFTLESIYYNFYNGQDMIDFFNNYFHPLDSCDDYFKLDQIKEEDYSRFLKFSLYSKDLERMKNVLHEFKDHLNANVNPDLKNCHNGEITPFGISKQTGMQFVLNELKMDQKDSIALGDSNNDYKALEFAHIKIAMGNATDSLKEIANYITDTDEDYGFYTAFKHFKLI